MLHHSIASEATDFLLAPKRHQAHFRAPAQELLAWIEGYHLLFDSQPSRQKQKKTQ